MTTVEEALYAYLSADATLSGLVGTRIYPLTIPPDVALPAVAYQRVTTPRVHSHSGPSGLASPRFQFTCVAKSYAEAKQIADALRGALDGFHGTMSALRVDNVMVVNEFVDYVPDTQAYVIRLDAIIWHEE